MERKQVLVIGLGQFGMSLTRALVDRGAEVIAVDLEEAKVQTAASFTADSFCFDATDEEALARINPAQRDVCICATGDQSKEAGIICTALLKQMGAKRIVARANDDLHRRILLLVGAHQVVNPEREFGERFSNQIVYERVLGELALGSDLVITELRAPEVFIGKNLIELNLRKRFGVTIVAIKEGEHGRVGSPEPEQVVNQDDILVVVSKENAVARMIART